MAECGGDSTMQYVKENGPVVLVITSGFSTLGKFRCAQEKDFVFTEFGAGDLADTIPDIFPVPLSGDALDNRSVLIVGNYRAGNPAENKQIKVTYTFMQKSVPIGEVQITEKSSTVLHCSHMVTFTKQA